MKNSNLLAVATLIMVTVMPSCDHNDHISVEKPFDIKQFFVAGTTTPPSGSYRSVYLIKFLEENKAVIISSGPDFTADYSLTKDSLTVTVSDPQNYRTYRYSVDGKHNITSAYYKALTMEYKTTGSMIPISANNLLAGKTFKGEEFKMGPVSFRKDLYYKFSSDGKSFGTGLDLGMIDEKAFPYDLINGAAFKSKSGNTTQIGFFTDSLTVFRSSGLYYFGNYAKQ